MHRNATCALSLAAILAAPAAALAQRDAGLAPDLLPFDDGVPPPPDPFEPNETCAEATPVALPFSYGALEMRTGDVDCFAFDATAGAILQADAVVFSPQLVALTVTDPSGNVVASTPFGRLLVSLPSDGRYCASVSCTAPPPRDDGGGLPFPDAVPALDAGTAECDTRYQLSLALFTLLPDRYEPNDTPGSATPVSAPFFSPDTTIFPAGDVDVFRTENRAGDVITAGAWPTRSFFDIWVELSDDGGVVLASGPNTIDVAVPHDGPYFLTVRSWPGGGTGEYSLWLDIYRVEPDRFEPNDSLASAAPVDLPFSDRGLSLFPERDVDCFQASGPAGAILDVNAYPAMDRGPPVRPEVTVFDAGGAPIASGGGSVRVLLPADGTFFACVTTSDPNSVGNYGMEIGVYPMEPDRFEPNDTPETATPIALPFDAFELTIAPAGDVDVFRVDGRAFDYLTVWASPLRSIGLDPVVELIGPRGELLASGYYGAATILAEDGPHLVVVHSALPEGIGQYQVSVRVERIERDVFEPNDTLETATPLTPPYSHVALTLTNGDVDVFTSAASAGALVELYTFPGMIGPSVATEVRIHDAAGAVIGSGLGGARARLAESGTFFVSVRSASGGIGSYGMTFLVTELRPDRFEPNDTLATATPFYGPYFYTGDLTIAPAGDVDLFVSDGRADDLVFVSARDGLFPFEPQVAVLDAAGDPLAAGPYSAQASLREDGPFFVSVSGLPGEAGSYELSIEVRSLPFDPFEPNDTLATATPIQLPPDFYADASLRRGDLDFFRFDAVADSTLDVAALPYYGGSARVGVFDGAGALLATDPYGVHLALPAAGTYYIGVSSEDDPAFEGARTAGGYSLRVHLLPPPVIHEPGHTLSIAVPGFAGAGVAADPETGDVYALARDTRWRMGVLAGGSFREVQVEVPREAGFYPYLGTDLELRRGFGGFDLFTGDSSGQTLAFHAPDGTGGAVFAATGASLEMGLAFGESNLFVSSGAYSFPTIWSVDAAGVVSTFMGPESLGSSPASLAIGPDGRALHYATSRGEIVTVDVASAAEVSRVVTGGTSFGPPNFTVDPATGDLYVVVEPILYSDLQAIVRYRPSTGALTPFADNLPGANDVAFGPCGATSCLWVTTLSGIMRIDGFERPFQIRDPTGDARPPFDVTGVRFAYRDLLDGGSSTHMEAEVFLGAPLPARGEVHVLIDFGETAVPGADIDLRARFQNGRLSWSGIAGLADRSYVDGARVVFLAPIDALRRRADEVQRAAAAERIQLWVTTQAQDALQDRAPDAGVATYRSFFPRLVVMPARVDFGGVRLGDRGVRPLAIANHGVGALALESVRAAGNPAFAVEGAFPPSVAEGTSALVTVTCAPPRAGSYAGTLQVQTRGPNVVREVPLTCAGFTPPSAPLVFDDAAGDAFGRYSGRTDLPDLLEVSYTIEGREAVFRQTYDRDVQLFTGTATGAPGTIAGFLELDLDRNTATGFCAGCNYGAEYAIGSEQQVSFFYVPPDGRIDLGNGLFGTARTDGPVLELRLPDAFVLGGGCFDFAVATGTPAEPADFSPDEADTANAVIFGCYDPTRREEGVDVDGAAWPDPRPRSPYPRR